jgi:hypothetical protein
MQLSRFLAKVAVVRQASLIRGSLPLGFELIDRDH